MVYLLIVIQSTPTSSVEVYRHVADKLSSVSLTELVASEVQLLGGTSVNMNRLDRLVRVDWALRLLFRCNKLLLTGLQFCWLSLVELHLHAQVLLVRTMNEIIIHKVTLVVNWLLNCYLLWFHIEPIWWPVLLHHRLHIPLPGSLLALHGCMNTDIMLEVCEVILLSKGRWGCCGVLGHLWSRINHRLHLRKSWILVCVSTWYWADASSMSLHLAQLSRLLLKFLGSSHSQIIIKNPVDLVAWPIRAPYWPLVETFLLPLRYIPLLWAWSVIHRGLLVCGELIHLLKRLYELAELLLSYQILSCLLWFHWNNHEQLLLGRVFMLNTLIVGHKLGPELWPNSLCRIDSHFRNHQLLSVFWSSLNSLNSSGTLKNTPMLIMRSTLSVNHIL